MIETLFHSGERAAQALAGAASLNAAIRNWMPDQHRVFFGLLAFLPVATIDPHGAPVATILTGVPGFIKSPDANSLQIAAQFDAVDPAAPFFLAGAPVGMLGIDLATRRRNRANGTLRSIGPEGMTVAVTQSFGNCPQYIQTRFWHEGAGAPGVVEWLDGLDAAARATIAVADTFFVASSSGGGAGAMGGVDISHRGGRPGFIAVDGDTLTIPDFHGNGYFNTFGNLLVNPRTTLLFVDWSTGSVLHLSGRAEVQWSETGGLAGAERLWRVSVDSAWRRPAALPLRWSFGDFAPQIARTGSWAAPLAAPALPRLETAADFGG
jgi:uncharacterized protein